MALTINKMDPEIPGSIPQIKVMGVDPSTHTGLVVLKGPIRLYSYVVEYPDLKGYKRLQSIANEVCACASKYQPDLIYIERPITGGKFNAQIQMYLAALVRDRLYTNGFPWYDVSPTTLKKWTTGKGKATKDMMMNSVKERWGFITQDNNLADAYALAKLGQHVDSMKLSTFKGVACGD